MARESCRQGPSFASRSPKSRMARRCCQRRPAFPRQRHAAWPNGLCAMRQRHAQHAAWPNGLCALRRGPGLLAACAPPLSSRLCPPRPAPPAISPAFITAVLYASRFAARIASTARRHPPRRPLQSRVSRLSGSSCRPRAAHADASRPSMRARRHRLGPDPREPSPSPEPTGPQPRASRVPAHPWSRLRPSAPCHPPRLALPRGSRCGSGNSREMVR